MITIYVPDMNDSISSIKIDGVNYMIRFTYNSNGDYWSFGILDRNEKNIVAMTKIVPNYPITHWYQALGIPKGIFGCVTNLTHVGRHSFSNGDAEFVYIPPSEVE